MDQICQTGKADFNTIFLLQVYSHSCKMNTADSCASLL
ncbi:hypothetical protein SLEP1_g41845 [Rubroshorea leprosula]|uniref:Uncharacterized protein n=1 Tax=Rubroshorea leprosula TaxID=152421 RepID=A0AAV5L8G3_9ROSI|nr:hypothetical protein SLEP1_g41845 [Rubroshorea leprosula]